MTHNELMEQVYKYRNNPGMQIWKLNQTNGEWEQQKGSDPLSVLDESDRVIVAYEKPQDLIEQREDEPAIAHPVQPATGKLEQAIDSILAGIDQCEMDGGWWETSDGAAFGKKKLAEIKAFFAHAIAQPVQPSQARELSKDDVRAAGGIVHSDGNIFFTNIDKLNAAINGKGME